MLWILGGCASWALAALLAALGWAASLTGSGAAALPALDFETRTVTTSIRNEPPNLDSTRSKDVESYRRPHTVMEGLLRYDAARQSRARRRRALGGRTAGATFWLRENARWSDGKPVTAHDFVFAWRTGRRAGDGVRSTRSSCTR